jgi:hypothetical protein
MNTVQKTPQGRLGFTLSMHDEMLCYICPSDVRSTHSPSMVVCTLQQARGNAVGTFSPSCTKGGLQKLQVGILVLASTIPSEDCR